MVSGSITRLPHVISRDRRISRADRLPAAHLTTFRPSQIAVLLQVQREVPSQTARLMPVSTLCRARASKAISSSSQAVLRVVAARYCSMRAVAADLRSAGVSLQLTAEDRHVILTSKPGQYRKPSGGVHLEFTSVRPADSRMACLAICMYVSLFDVLQHWQLSRSQR